MPTYLSPGIYVEEMEAGSRPIEGVGTAIAAFVGFAERGRVNEPVLVTNWREYTTEFGEFVADSYLAHSVYGFFANGGGKAFVVRVGANGNGTRTARGELGVGDKKQPAYRIEALEPATNGSQITVEFTEAKRPAGDTTAEPGAAGASNAGAASAPAEPLFTITVRRAGAVAEEFDGLSAKKGARHAPTIVNEKSELIRLEEIGTAGALERMPTGSVTLREPDTGRSPVRPDDYIGSSADRTGLGVLEAVDEITMLCVPDLMAAYQAGLIDLEGVKAVQLAMISHCENMGDRVAIIDAPPDHNAQEVKDWRVSMAGYDSKYAALYWPWIKVQDPLSGAPIMVPPSGHVAGVWGRSDDTRGVHKAPANEVVRNVLDLEYQITKNEHDLLNPHGINVIRSFPNRGTRIWGARTLSSDPAWRYLNVRRLFNYLEESILVGTQWCVFEPNDHTLWAKMRRTISSFLLNEWRKGALFGLVPEHAFYVKCDAENNPVEQIEAGLVVCEIGVAPVKPAEFVVFRLSQFSGGADVGE